ncbi:MAG: glycoside hydrolase family 3 N-terminal domain-containing protein [Limnochordia bacterium]|jgi:beta-glucosidase
MAHTYLDSRLPVETRVEALLAEMTLEEKVAQLGSVLPQDVLENGEFSEAKAEKVLKHGIGQISRMAGFGRLEPAEAAKAMNALQSYLREKTRLGIPALNHEECLSGFMGKHGLTVPQAIGLASTWNPDLVKEITEVVAGQLRAVGAHHGLSPVLDVARDLRWGRTEETFGEDPYLVAAMGTAYIRGLQGDASSPKVIATAKHFVAHSAPEGGRNHAPVNVSPRVLREVFCFPFEAAVKEAAVGSVMNAYHDIDGVPCTSSKELLTDLLRGEWGFDGIVVSDYGSIPMLYTDHRVATSMQEAGILALEAGLDLELPTTECYGEFVAAAVREGLLSEKTVDQAVRRILRLKFKLGLFENPFVKEDGFEALFETPAQRDLAREAARQSLVLLKNEGGLLPIDTRFRRIAVIGPSADSTRNLLGDYTYGARVEDQAGHVEVISILEGIRRRAGDGYEIVYAPGLDDVMSCSREGFAQAVKAAQSADLAIVVVGGRSGLSRGNPAANTDGEGHDRTELTLTGAQEELIRAVFASGTPVVAVVVSGRPLAVEWLAENVPAIVQAWLPGSEGGSAVADILFGVCDPGGRLPVSIPRSVGQLPVHYNRTFISANRDYVASDGRARYPFGHGLSYTEFRYDSLRLSTAELPIAGQITISASVTNVGTRGGWEVVQLYVRDVAASVTRPVKELKGFHKVWLEPGETCAVDFTLAADQLALWNTHLQLVVEPGEFEVMVGRSSEDIRLMDRFTITGQPRIVKQGRTYFTISQARKAGDEC